MPSISQSKRNNRTSTTRTRSAFYTPLISPSPVFRGTPPGYIAPPPIVRGRSQARSTPFLEGGSALGPGYPHPPAGPPAYTLPMVGGRTRSQRCFTTIPNPATAPLWPGSGAQRSSWGTGLALRATPPARALLPPATANATPEKSAGLTPCKAVVL